MLEKLLDDVVPEDVRHERVCRALDLREDHVLVLRTGALQLLLDEPRAVLVLGELDNVAADVPQGHVGEAVISTGVKRKGKLLSAQAKQEIFGKRGLRKVGLYGHSQAPNVNCNKAFPV